MQVFLPEEEPAAIAGGAGSGGVSRCYVQRAGNPEGRGRNSMLIARVNGVPVAEHPLARFLLDAGFLLRRLGSM